MQATYDDVSFLRRLADQLRAEQYRMLKGETWLEELELVHVTRFSLSAQQHSFCAHGQGRGNNTLLN
jgi:hypothetical protein